MTLPLDETHERAHTRIMTSRTCSLIHDDGGTTVTIYEDCVQTERFYAHADSGVMPLSLVPLPCTLTVERTV